MRSVYEGVKIYFAAFLAAGFLAGAFFAAGFLVAAVFAAGFSVAAGFVAAGLAAVFFAAGFFAAGAAFFLLIEVNLTPASLAILCKLALRRAAVFFGIRFFLTIVSSSLWAAERLSVVG